MVTFVQMSEEDPAYGLVILLEDLKLSPAEKQAKAARIQQAEAAAADEEVDLELEEAKKTKLGGCVASGNFEGLLRDGVLGSMKALLNAPEQVVEAGFSLAFSLLARLTEAVRDDITSLLLSALTNGAEAGPASTLRLQLLGVLFNLAAPGPGRFPIFMSLCQHCAGGERPALLEGAFQHLPSWTEEWGLTAAQRAQLYLAVAAVVGGQGDHKQKQTYELLYLQSMETEQARDSAAVRAVASGVCLAAINHFKETAETNPCFDCARVVALAVVQDLKKDKETAPLLELTTIFAQKEVCDYIAFHKKNAAFITGLGLDDEENLSKLRTVTMCSMGMDKEKLSFTELMSKLQLKDEDEVEGAIMDAVMSGRLQAKIDQEKGEVLVQRTTQRLFASADWGALSTKLEGWQANISGVIANLHQIQSGPGQEQITEA